MTAIPKSTSTDSQVNFADALNSDSTVRRMHDSGRPFREMVAVLAAEKAELLKRCMELESISPKRMKLPDGRTVVWHCPDNLVPEIKL